MVPDFKKELTWFTQRLLEIRITKVRGIGTPIPFKLSDIKELITTGFFDSGVPPKEHLEELVEEIRQFYIKDSGNTTNGDRIKLVYHDDDSSVKIYGLDSDLLRSFLKTQLKSHTSLFKTGAGGALLYIGSPTGITLNAAQQTIFARFRCAKDQLLSYDEIFEICAIQKGTGREGAYRAKHPTKPNKDSVARSAISDLLKRVKKSEMLESINSEGIIANKSGEGYQLMM